MIVGYRGFHVMERLVIRRRGVMGATWSRIPVAAALAIAVWGTGCVTWNRGPLKPVAPDLLTAHASEGNVEVGAAAHFTEDESVRLLGTDVTESLAPVVLMIRNVGKQPIVIELSDIALVSSDQMVAKGLEWSVALESFQASVGLRTVLLGAKAGVSALEENETRATDWRQKALPEQTLVTRNRLVGGVVYFRKNMGRPPFSVVVKATNVDGSDPTRVEVPLPP